MSDTFMAFQSKDFLINTLSIYIDATYVKEAPQVETTLNKKAQRRDILY